MNMAAFRDKYSLICVVGLLLIILCVNPSIVQAGVQAGTCQEKDAEVLILGAGLAGLGAARTLSLNGVDNFLIIEQDLEIGGRAKSRKFAGTTVELGAQWIVHADPTNTIEERRHPFLNFADRCNITYRPAPYGSTGFRVYTRDGTDITTSQEVQDAFSRYLNAEDNPSVLGPIFDALGEDDTPLSNGLRAGGWFPITPIEEWVEAFNVDFVGFAESSDHQSYKYIVDPEIERMRRRSFGENTGVFIVTDDVGYVGIAQCIARDFMTDENDTRLILETVVRTIEWSQDCVCVATVQNGEDRRYCGTYAISTIPLGFIQNNGLTFIPPLPARTNIALYKVTMGRFMRIYASYNETFWDTDVDLIGYIDDINGRDHYTLFTPWGAFFPEGSRTNVIQALLYGDIAKRVSYQDKEITRKQIGEALRNIYGPSVSDPLDIIASPFTADPYFLGNLGGIPTPGVNNDTYDTLNEPLGNLYFAGDFTAYHFHSTAHGAFIFGSRTAERIVQLMQQPPQVTFINNSPRVQGRSISAEFTVSKSVEILDCILDNGEREDCSSGQVAYTNVTEGRHVLRIIARNEPISDRSTERRELYVSDSPHCAVHLINGGITVSGNDARVEFVASGLPVSGFTCFMDSVRIFECSSPLELRNLNPGSHRIRIRPQCEGEEIQQSHSFFTQVVTIGFELATYSARENQESLEVCATLQQGDLERVVLVNFNTQDLSANAGGDYISANVVLTFNSEIDRQCVDISLVNDDSLEALEEFEVTLSVDEESAVVLEPSKAVISIIDDDVLFEVTFPTEVCESNSNPQICIELVTATDTDIEVSVNTRDISADSADYVPVSTVFTFSEPSEQCETVTIIDDGVAESCESFAVEVSADTDSAIFNQSNITTTILDNTEIGLRFINDTPRVDGNDLTVIFQVDGSQCVEVSCEIIGRVAARDCTPLPSSGGVGEYFAPDFTSRLTLQRFTMTATPFCGQSAVQVERQFRTDNSQCSVIFINDGVSFEDNDVIVEFEGTGPNEATQVSEFICTLDGGMQVQCQSPYTLPIGIDGLAVGSHVIVVTPVSISGCSRTVTRSFQFEI